MDTLIHLLVNNKKEKKDMTNLEIYSTANNLMEAFGDSNQKLPIKVNFFLQRNKKTLVNLAQEIEDARMNIAKSYGTLDPDTGHYAIAQENILSAQEELNQLFNIEQDVDIKKINFDDLDPNMELTTAQMEALMFMIE